MGFNNSDGHLDTSARSFGVPPEGWVYGLDFDEVTCTGAEVSIHDCPGGFWGVGHADNNCRTRGDAVGIKCKTADPVTNYGCTAGRTGTYCCLPDESGDHCCQPKTAGDGCKFSDAITCNNAGWLAPDNRPGMDSAFSSSKPALKRLQIRAAHTSFTLNLINT